MFTDSRCMHCRTCGKNTNHVACPRCAGAPRSAAEPGGMHFTSTCADREIGVWWAAIRRLRADVPGLTVAQAAAYLRQLLVEGRLRSTPRHWMRHGRFKPGSSFIYSHLEPDYCLVVRGDTVRELIIRGDALPVATTAPGRPRPDGEPFDRHDLDLELELEPDLTQAA